MASSPQKIVINVHDSHPAPVVQKVDNAVHRRNLYPVDSAVGFPKTYLPDSDLLVDRLSSF